MARLPWTALPLERRAQSEDPRERYRDFLVKAATHDRTSLIEFLIDGWLPGGEVWDEVVLERALINVASSWHAHAAILLLDLVKTYTYTPDALQAALFAAVDSKFTLPQDPGGPVYEGVDYTNEELLVRRLIEDGRFDPNISHIGRPLIHHAIEPAHRIGALRALLEKGESLARTPRDPGIYPSNQANQGVLLRSR